MKNKQPQSKELRRRQESDKRQLVASMTYADAIRREKLFHSPPIKTNLGSLLGSFSL